ncbi:DUF1003 domain-containing protein [Pseudoxanthomonas composti]|uniref:DUF1003 domain-containing protein n=1 Tax=Pseudoxanthomonas composti TaxID=2137479 RepID=A0A4Q1JUM6_9GAMM|nr:DUF1003 domain-containing protein [Pseudoxanthomonas composti]RXR05412.1 DUF1003 domain-containing protein [Pseudoxanthomonas composti]
MNTPHPPTSESRHRSRIDRRQTARQLLQRELDTLQEEERAIVERFISRRQVARNVDREFDQGRSFGERVADKVAAVGGSWRFIIAFGVFLAVWMALNSLVLAKAFDPYPYILLNLCLSCLAAIQAPIIMMSQNRQASADRLRAENDYQVNVKAELEILQVHEKLNQLREQDWAALVELQNQQIQMLQQLLAQRTPPSDQR